MTPLDVQHTKIYKTRFQGTQVEALKDIHLPLRRGNTPLVGNQDPEIDPSQYPSHADDGRAGLPKA